jgi:hypothetical protein
LCTKCINGHPSKHSIKNFRDAVDDVMNNYKSMLDKINDGRDRTDQYIETIRLQMF